MKTEETHAEGTFLLDNRRNNFTDYDCSMCSLKFSSENLLTAHKIRKHKRRTRNDINYDIFCDVCNKGYTRRFDMERHRKTKHSDVSKFAVEDFVEDSTEGEYENKSNSLPVCEDVRKSTDFTCKICEGKFEKQSELRVHERKVHGVFKFRRKQGEIVAEYFCDICNKGFTRNHDMKKHRRRQHPDVPTPAALLTNRKERASYLMRTKITGPDDKIYYKCETCDKVFRQSYNLMRHQTIHTGVRAYFCHICGKNFPSSNGLKRHITEHHYGVKKYSCEVCGKRFAASATRNEHLNIHTDTRPFICDICGKSFKQKASLHTHKLFHTNNFRFSCNVCGKKFRRGSELKIHTWLHTGHKPHQCHLCPSSFRLRQDLKRHIRVHDKLNECVCNECGSTFSQEKYLNNHKRTHKSRTTISFLSTNIKQEESQVIIFDVHHSS